MDSDRGSRIENQRRLRALALDHRAEVDLCCGHDPGEFEAMAGRPAGRPVDQAAAVA